MSFNQIAMLAAVSLGLMTAAIPASRAATSTAAMAVSATVAPHCQVEVPTNRADPARRAHTLAVTCDMNVPYNVTFGDEAAPATRSFTALGDESGRIAATITY